MSPIGSAVWKVGLILVIALAAGCSSAPRVRERLRTEWAEPTASIERATNQTGRISFADASLRWAERDPEAMQQLTRLLSQKLDIAEAKSWIWPRADIEVGGTAALEKGDDSPQTAPYGGVVLRYDFRKMVFRSDAAAVAEAGRDVCYQKALIAIEGAVGRLEDLLLEWRQLRQAVALEAERGAELRRLVTALDSLDALGALPAGSFAEWKRRAHVAERERNETTRRLDTLRELLQSELGLAPEAEPDVGDLGFLESVPDTATNVEGDWPRWLPAVWRAQPSGRVAELELFQAEMAMVEAKRERLPRLSGSIGVGDFYTWVGTDRVEARGVGELGVSMPLFDAGTIRRGIEKARLSRDLARRNAQLLVRRLARDAQNAAATLRSAREESAHRQAESEEVRRLSATAQRGATLGQGDPLLPFALRVYRIEAELGLLEAKTRLAKASRAYRVAMGEKPVPGLAESILESWITDLGAKDGRARK